VLVFLVRHAHSDPGEPDETRVLSERGKAEAHALAERLARHSTPPRLVLTSPLTRAEETAAAIAKATGAELRVEARLSPGATAETLRDAVRDESGPLAAVGHQPDCSEIARALTGGDPGFRPAGVVEIELER
jgi:phosphohistidine phosphatase SixA